MKLSPVTILVLAVPGRRAAIQRPLPRVCCTSAGLRKLLGDAERCIKKQPDKAMAHFSRANALQELNRWEEAADLLSVTMLVAQS